MGQWVRIVRLAVVASCTAAVLLAVVGGAGARGIGSIEICKDGANGAAGTMSSFSATSPSGAMFATAVKGGTCSESIATAAGTYTITEDLSSGLWQLTGAQVVPSTAWVSENDAVGRVKVKVVAGGETQLIVTDEPASATLKVCKWSSSSALQGAQFSFTVGQRTVSATAGKSAATAGCSMPITTQPGSRLRVTESTPDGEAVARITAGGCAQLTPLAAGAVKVTAGAGVNVVTFENEPAGPPQTGFVEVCKDAGDEFVSATTPFTFTIKDQTGSTDTEQVVAGQCSGPVEVAAGNVEIAEAPTAGTALTGVSTFPNAAALGVVNLVNGTATVVVPVSATPAGEVQATFVNSTLTGTLKICKLLTASSAALAGQPFRLDYTSSSGISGSVTVVASSGQGGACKIVTGSSKQFWTDGSGEVLFPVGDQVSAVEAPAPFVQATSSPVTIRPGINTLTVTNQAYGQLEICKHVAVDPADRIDIGDGFFVDPDYSGITFHFSVDGSKKLVDVAAGACSQPILVTPGTHTVEEVNQPYGFQFVSATASGPLGDNRGSGGNPISVTVPWMNDPNGGGETIVHVTDQVTRATVKVCKRIGQGSEAALGSLPFTFDVDATIGNDRRSDTVSTAPPYPSCTGQALDLPLVDENGDAITVTVTEHAGPGFEVSGITVDHVRDGTTPQVTPGVGGSVTFTPAAGTAVVTFTNAPSSCGLPIAYTTLGTNLLIQSLLPIDTTNDATLPEMAGGTSPYEIAITPDGKTAVMGNDDTDINGHLTITNLVTGAFATTGFIDPLPRGIAITPDGKTAYVASNLGHDVFPIDIATAAAGPAIPVGAAPWGIAITPDGRFAYVALANDKVGKIDLSTNTFLGPVTSVGLDPRGLAITPDGQRAYVANHGDDTVSVIDLATGTVTQTIDLPTGSKPLEIAITRDGTKAFVTDEGTDSVTPIELPSGTVDPSIAVGSDPGSGQAPRGLAITPDGRKVYVAVPGGEGQFIAVIDVATMSWVDSIDADNPNYVAIGCSSARLDTQLEITKDDGVETAPTCGTIKWTIVVTNTGGVDATGVRVVDTPAGGFVPGGSPNLPPGVQFDQATLTWTIGTLAPGESVTLSFEGSIPGRGAVRNIASVSADNAPVATAQDFDRQGPPVVC